MLNIFSGAINKYNRTQLSASLWWSWCAAIDAYTHADTHTCAWPCPCPNSPSIVRGSNGVDQLQLRHPFTLPPSLSPNPPSCVTAGPSFLPSSWHRGLGESQGSQDGRMWPDQTNRQTDWQGTDMQTGGCCCCCRCRRCCCRRCCCYCCCCGL